jgi:hypothetical protein
MKHWFVDAAAIKWRQQMRNRVHKLTAAALVAASLASLPNIASATPVADALAIKNAAPTDIEAVRWGWGWGFGAGFLGGAVLGGALARPYYYYPPAYYYGYPAYYPAPAYAPPPPAYYDPGPPAGDAYAYCAHRYRSYDPATGTFLGNDGLRHPCP